jgi:hypothetical protein
MEMFDEYVLTTLRIDKDGKVIGVNVRTFDAHDAEAHRHADAVTDLETFSVEDDLQEE